MTSKVRVSQAVLPLVHPRKTFPLLSLSFDLPCLIYLHCYLIRHLHTLLGLLMASFSGVSVAILSLQWTLVHSNLLLASYMYIT